MELESPQLTFTLKRYARAARRLERAPFWRRKEAVRTLERSRHEYVKALIRTALEHEPA
jgi:hypothetical protein